MHRATIADVRVGMLGLLAGCWTTTSTPIAPPEPAVSDSRPYAESFQHQRPASSGPRNAIPRRSVWSGTYICSQGLTAVTLTLELSGSGELGGMYEFGPVPSNPTVPEGSFAIRGHLMATGPRSFTGEIEPGDWIKHPPTYQAVAFSIEANDREMTGTLNSPHCRDFKVTRVE